MKIEKLDKPNLTDNQWDELYRFTSEIFAEIYPNHPIPTLEQTKKNALDSDESVIDEQFVIRDKNGIVARSRIVYEKPSDRLTEDELKQVFMDIRVRCDMRKKGIAKQMVSHLLENKFLPRHKETHLWAKVDAGHEFCKKIGGKIERELFFSNLELKGVDWEQIGQINKIAQKRSKGINTNITEGISEKDEPEYIELLADLTEELSTYCTTGGFKRELFISETKKMMKKSREDGEKSYISWARDVSGKLTAFSELTFDPDSPDRLGTRMTGVIKEHRNKGLCKRMKTDLLLYVRNHLPEIKKMTTDNDKDNKIMRVINDQLGFVPENPTISYTYDVDELRKRLK